MQSGYRVATGLALLFMAGCSDRAPTVVADAIYGGGDIVTMEGDSASYVEAVAVKDGRIVLVGSRAEADKLQGRRHGAGGPPGKDDASRVHRPACPPLHRSLDPADGNRVGDGMEYADRKVDCGTDPRGVHRPAEGTRQELYRPGEAAAGVGLFQALPWLALAGRAQHGIADATDRHLATVGARVLPQRWCAQVLQDHRGRFQEDAGVCELRPGARVRGGPLHGDQADPRLHRQSGAVQEGPRR